MHCLHLVSHKPYFQNRTYNGYNKNKIAMANFFHIADFENAFWSITPGVALNHTKNDLYATFHVNTFILADLMANLLSFTVFLQY